MGPQLGKCFQNMLRYRPFFSQKSSSIEFVNLWNITASCTSADPQYCTSADFEIGNYNGVVQVWDPQLSRCDCHAEISATSSKIIFVDEAPSANPQSASRSETLNQNGVAQAHEDGPAYCPVACILSLGGPAIMRFARKQPGAGRAPRLPQLHMQFQAECAHSNNWGICARQVPQADGAAALLPVHCRSPCCLL